MRWLNGLNSNNKRSVNKHLSWNDCRSLFMEKLSWSSLEQSVSSEACCENKIWGVEAIPISNVVV